MIIELSSPSSYIVSSFSSALSPIFRFRGSSNEDIPVNMSSFSFIRTSPVFGFLIKYSLSRLSNPIIVKLSFENSLPLCRNLTIEPTSKLSDNSSCKLFSKISFTPIVSKLSSSSSRFFCCFFISSSSIILYSSLIPEDLSSTTIVP